MKEWQRAADRRSDMKGLEEGINMEATLAMSSSNKTSPADKALLRTIQSGGLWTQDRKHRAGM
eukprot:6578188-Karenia_brevis.AAC.1